MLVSGSGALPIPTMPGPTRDPRPPHEALRQNLQAAGDRARSVIWSTGRERESLVLRRQEYALAQARYCPPEMEEPPIRRTEPIVEPIPQGGFTTEDLREIRDVLHQGEVHIGEQGRRALRRAIQRVLTSEDQQVEPPWSAFFPEGHPMHMDNDLLLAARDAQRDWDVQDPHLVADLVAHLRDRLLVLYAAGPRADPSL